MLQFQKKEKEVAACHLFASHVFVKKGPPHQNKSGYSNKRLLEQAFTRTSGYSNKRSVDDDQFFFKYQGLAVLLLEGSASRGVLLLESMDLNKAWT